MASPSKVHLTVENTGVVQNKPQTSEAAAKVSELLQENHEKHHIFFNKAGFHNHIVHHLLTIYALGAPASVIEKRYAENASYQLPANSSDEVPLTDLRDPETFAKCLGSKNQKYYHSFLKFWQSEMEAKGWENVLNEYVFAGTERADDLLARFYAGFLHSLIHLGFGIEFQQPAIIAEALAQACVHDYSWTGELMTLASSAAKSNPPTTTPKTMFQLLDDIRADKKLSTAAQWSDDNKVRDGIVGRAAPEMIKYATQWVVTPENLEQKTNEMISAVIYYTAAAQRPPKQVKIDFYYMHCVNSSIFFPTFNKQAWLSTENKVKLLQWKGYMDLAMYASRRSPELLLEEIATYVPTKMEKGEAEWPGIFGRLWEFQDDGHAIKLGRAVRNGELMAERYGEPEGAKIKGFMWEKIGNMVIDSVEDDSVNWARSVGFDEAWADYKDRPRQARI